MSLFGRKKKKKTQEQDLGQTEYYDISELTCPKTDPGFRTAGSTVNHALASLDKQIEEKRVTKNAAKKITSQMRAVNLALMAPKKA